MEAPRMISPEELVSGWDTERSVHELNELTVNIKGTTLYIPAKTKSSLEAVHGGPVSTVRFRTLPDFRVWLAPCLPTDEGARKLIPTSDTRSAAHLAFAIPLRKLGITVPPTRQYTFNVKQIPVTGGGAVFEISFKGFSDDPRKHVDEELIAAIKKAKALKAKANRERKRAERLAKLQGSGTATDTPS